jgi:hypothetical protein
MLAFSLNDDDQPQEPQCLLLAELDALAVNIIVRNISSALDLAACGATCTLLRAECADELVRRSRELVHGASASALPAKVMMSSGVLVGRSIPVDDLVGLAARYAGGWTALLAGREGFCDTTSPDGLNVATPHGSTDACGSFDTAEEAALARAALARTALARTAALPGAGVSKQVAEALVLYDLVELLEDDQDMCPHGRVVWTGVLPLLDEVNQVRLSNPAGREPFGCALLVNSPELPGAPRAWRHFFSDADRPPTFLVSGDFDNKARRAATAPPITTSPLLQPRRRRAPQGRSWLVRISVLSPDVTETLVCQKSLRPSTLLRLAAGRQDMPPHYSLATYGEPIRRDSGSGGAATAGEPPHTMLWGADAATEVSDRSARSFVFTCLVDKGADITSNKDSAISYWTVYMWVEFDAPQVWVEFDVPQLSFQPKRFHLDVDLSREDRLWELDLARGNKAPRLLAQQCAACKAWRLRNGRAEPTQPRWVPPAVDLSPSMRRAPRVHAATDAAGWTAAVEQLIGPDLTSLHIGPERPYVAWSGGAIS